MFVKNNNLIDKFLNIGIKYHFDVIFLITISLVVAINIPGLKMLGLWESLYYYHTFGALSAPLEFLISPRGNIGDPGYFAIEISRYLINFLSLNLSLESYRIPSISYGILSTLVFYQFCKIYFKKTSAFIASVLLMLNPMYQQQEHTMTVLIVSGLVFMFFIRRLQVLESNYYKFLPWCGYFIAIVFMGYQYGVIKICGVIFFVFWMTKNAWILKDYGGGNTTSKYLVSKSFFLLFLAQIFLFIFDFRNLSLILRPDLFLLPPSSEISIYSNLYENISLGFIDTVKINSKIILENILLWKSDYHSSIAAYRAFDFRYPVITWVVLPSFLVGFFITIFRLGDSKNGLQKPYLTTLILFLIALLPAFFSGVFKGYPNLNDGVLSTLSNHRLFLVLYPIYLFIAIFFNFLLNYFEKYKILIKLLGIILIFLSTTHLLGQNQKFNLLIKNNNPLLNGYQAYKQWNGDDVNFDRQIELASHIQQHAQYIHMASKIYDLVNPLKGNLIINVSLDNFSESTTSPYSLHYINFRNFHNVFLNLYLSELGVRSSWVLIYSSDNPPLSLGFTSPRVYSNRLNPTNGSKSFGLEYEGRDLNYEVMHFGKQGPIQIIVCTTPSEIISAKSYFGKQNLQYKLVDAK